MIVESAFQTTWFLAGAGLVAALLLLIEFGARLAVRLIGYWSQLPFSRTTFHVHPKLVAEGCSPLVSYTCNRYGERLVHAGEPSPDALHVLYCGSSFVSCGFLDTGKDWPTQVTKRLNTTLLPRGISVSGSIMAGSGLESIDVLEMLAKSFARRARVPEVLVVSVGASDVARWVDAALLGNQWPERQSPDEVYGAHPENIQWRWRRLAVRRLARYAREIRSTGSQKRPSGRYILEMRRRRADSTVIRTLASPDAMVERVAENVREIVKLARNTGVKEVIFVAFPWRRTGLEVSRDTHGLWLGTVSRGKDFQASSLNRAQLEGMILAVRAKTQISIETLGAVHVDCTGSVEWSLDCMYDDGHLTEEGATRFGEAVASHIAQVSMVLGDGE